VLDVGAFIAFERDSPSSDIADANVVLLARLLDAVVVTSDPGDLRQLDTRIELIPC